MLILGNSAWSDPNAQEILDYAEVEFVEHDLRVSTGAERSEEQCKTVLFKVEHTFREMSDPRWSAKSVNE